MSRMFRWIATALVFACLTAGTAQAWPSVSVRPALAAADSGSLLEAAWSWMASLFRPAEPSRDARATPREQQKYGCGMDPNGRPICIN
jgi:hypothetical protein